MKLIYNCQLQDKTISLTLNEGDKCITVQQAQQNLISIKEIIKDKPDFKQMKKENFKLWQTIWCYLQINKFISKYFSRTQLSKQMKCFIIWKWVKHNLGNYNWYRKLWHCQIASMVGCHYNTPKNIKHLIEELCKGNERTYQSGWYDFISYVVTKISKSCKERTVRPLFKAGPVEGLSNKRIKDSGCDELHELDWIDCNEPFATKIVNV